jgi:hypothetical protein
MDNALINESVKLHAFIRASEPWSDQYKKDPKTYAKLLKKEGQWQFAIRKWLKAFGETARDTNNIINWYEYARQNADYQVDVVFVDDGIDYQKSEFVKVSLDVVTELVTVGAQAGELIYQRPLGITTTNAEMAKLGTDTVARLVGKKVMPGGLIVDNSRAHMDITETIRKDIAQSIKTSLNLGETTQEASARVNKVINNPSRASLIAQTESVNAYQGGLRSFAGQAQMVGKEWQSHGTGDICAVYSGQGPVPLDHSFDGHDHPGAHPRCKCGMRYITLDEWVANNYGPNPIVDALLARNNQ